MKYFNNVKDLAEAKKLLKKLALENHPDRGGKTEIMQEINTEYSFIIAKLTKAAGFTQQQTDEELNFSEKYQAAINAIAGLENIIIELVGNWLWVTGSTREYKDILKAAGFLWAAKKQAWYFRSDAFKVKSRKRYDLEEIKNKYGCTKIDVNKKFKLAY